MPDWKQYEGELAGGDFPLERYLGGNEEAAVFLTRFASERAAIKLVRAGPAQAGVLVERWNHAATLRHPHLGGIFAAGTCDLAGLPLVYVVMEYGEENLAEVLGDRPLTTEETRDMLLPVAEALEYLHGQGLAHGNLKPSNVFAVQDTVKISSETVARGEPDADLQPLGVTLVQALTQRGPTGMPGGQDPVVDGLPEPFREIAQHCLHPDSRLRWSAGTVAARLRSPEPPVAAVPAPAAPAARGGKSRHYAAAVTVIAVGAAIYFGLVMRRADVGVQSPTDAVLPAPAAPPQPTAGPQTAAPPVQPEREAGPPPSAAAAQPEIRRRVLPDIPAKARNTIRGKATEIVRVAVDPGGSVTAATLERSVSPYFGRLVLGAARRWQFAPVEGAGTRTWVLRFEITRAGTAVTPRRVSRE